jgi:hypothetical protein
MRARVLQSVYYGDESINLQDAMIASGRISSYRDQARSGVRLYGTARCETRVPVRVSHTQGPLKPPRAHFPHSCET